MKNPLLLAGLATALCAAMAATAMAQPAQPAQSADLHRWTAAGDVAVDHASTARLTTAYADEAPLSAGAALLFDALETALHCPLAAWPPTRSKARACS